jgi:membrane-bound lytic murein transglycosylase B
MIRCLLLLLLASSPALGKENSYAARADVKSFIREVAARHGFSEPELRQIFSKVKRTDPVLESIKPPPPKARSWEEYRGIFVNEPRVAAGIAFWGANRAALERAQREFGVPAEVILAIIGIETYYGRNMGRWRVIEALTTLAFDYPPRADYFRSELESFLLLARERKLDVFALRGSYAGAIGIPQFMPSSTRRYAVDFDGDGTVDLLRNNGDAIGSVANFLKEHGWQPGGEAMLPARPAGEAWRPDADGAVEPKFPLADLKRAGVAFDDARHEPGTLAALIELETPDQPSTYFVGLRNFYVITRYNRSAFYGAAVAELAQALKQEQVNRGQSPISEK